MQIANIYPVANQKLYKQESFVMILAQFIDKYSSSNFKPSQYIIMDNGLYENQMVSGELLDCVRLAKNSKLPIREIIIPDAMKDKEETKALFEKNIPTIKRYNKEYRFMFVAQGNSYEDLEEMIDYVNQYNFDLSVGIPKAYPLDRCSDRAIEIYEKCKYPIHLLGLQKSFGELKKGDGIVRSCDSSQIAFIAKNSKSIVNVIDYIREGEPVDLEKDVLSESIMRRYRSDLFSFYKRKLTRLAEVPRNLVGRVRYRAYRGDILLYTDEKGRLCYDEDEFKNCKQYKKGRKVKWQEDHQN